MKKVAAHLPEVLLILFCSTSFAVQYRQDVGYYHATNIWRGDKLDSFADLDTNASDGSVTSTYAKSTFTYQTSERTSVDVFLEFTSTSINEFSAGGAQSGDRQSGLSHVGFNFQSMLHDGQTWDWGLEYGVKAPGSQYNPYRFNAIGDGATHYQVAATTNYSSSGMVGFYSLLRYDYRPGSIELKEGGVNYNLSRPDRIELELGVPIYLGSQVVNFSIFHSESLGGVDIGDADWVAFAQGAGQPGFPATDEDITTMNLTWAYYLSTQSLDVTLSHQVAGRNTDQGVGLNIGFTTEL